MNDLAERIARFENMAAADPDNEMAYFSLGNLYLQADRAADAAEALSRCIELNPEMSRAYQLAGDALVRSGRRDEAAQTLRRGYEVAAAKGDLMPRNAIAELLRAIGEEPPALAAASVAAGGGSFVCRRTGRPGTRLEHPPLRGPDGAWIQENISAETWRDWIAQGTKVINELRLDFSRDEDQATYDRFMREYLGMDEM